MVRDIPLSVYRTWPAPNYKDPITRGSGLVVINAIFISLVTISVAIRAYSRMKATRPGIDDVIYRLRLHHRLNGHRALGKSIIRLGPPYLGRSAARHSTSSHPGFLRKAGLRPRFLLYEAVPDLPLLSPHPGEYHQVVQVVNSFWSLL
jgi:hypothetical protein